MLHRYRIKREQFVPRPISQVFPFFSDAHNLERITPGFLRFRILTPAPIIMGTGTIIDYRLHILGIPQRWRTRIELFEPPRMFVDLQTDGPYAYWRHLHEFEETAEGSMIRDQVEYEMPFGFLGTLTHFLLVRHMLDRIFDFRCDSINKIFGSAADSGY